MRYLILVLDLAAAALFVAGAWLLAHWLALMAAAVILALLAMLLDPPANRGPR